MQPTPPGWYYDPQGRPSLWRWFTGRAWTSYISADPKAPPPVPPPVLPVDANGCVRAGGLSFPSLGEPWRAAPAYLDIDDEVGQELVVGRTARGPYIACVFLGALPEHYSYAGPGDLESAGTAIADDILTTYYPHETMHDRAFLVGLEIDGRPAWRTEITMEVDDDTLAFDKEEVAVTLVDLGTGKAGVLYASLPIIEPVPRLDSVVTQVRVET